MNDIGVLTGSSLIGATDVDGSGAGLNAVNPATGATLSPTYHLVDMGGVDHAVRLAEAAWSSYRETSDEIRAAFLESIAGNIEAIRAQLIERVVAETAIPAARVDGEVSRTAGQLRLFASVLRDGAWHGARIDHGDPDRVPLPRPDIRMRWTSVGPVAVFGASNFPLAFSVAGGDTASALAAGSPVVVKAHPSHPGTSELVGRAIRAAVAEHNLHEGVFSLLFVQDNDVARGLVAHPGIAAVGFTGSREAGLALVATAAARPRPIPVFAEMSSVNPVFIFPSALENSPEPLATAWVGSMNIGTGQLCTSPGVVVVPAGEFADRFVTAARDAVVQTTGTPMLSAAIAHRYAAAVENRAETAEVDSAARGIDPGGHNAGVASMFVTTAATFLGSPSLREEIFGPTGVVVLAEDAGQFASILGGLDGQLTVSIHCSDVDTDAAAFVAAAETAAGRIIFNGWPTGVEVGNAMVHGGPFPATSNAQTTSVGSAAIARFLRPISYQNAPQSFLAPELRDENPRGIWREIDGVGVRL